MELSTATGHGSGPSDGRVARVLFVMRSAGFLRNFENAVRALAARGHAITVAIESGDLGRPAHRALIDEVRAAGVLVVVAPSRERDARHRAATQVRLMLDYLRYLSPAFDMRPKLRGRAEAAVRAPLRSLVRRGASSRLLRQSLRVLDESAPVSPEVERFLDAHRCDVLLVTPLVELGAPQTDWLRAARRRGIPSALCVASWDNLTVKGGIRERPDRVLVWNDPQRDEAQRLHGLTTARVVVTGAHAYDHWFTWMPSRDRAAFCAEIGLLPDRPIILYVCSSPFIAPDEAEHVQGWLAALRSSAHDELREAGVLVRPHPQHARQWRGSPLANLAQVVIWPAGGADPVASAPRADLFDSVHHSAAVVGVNTSAMIESAIIGRPVLALLGDRYEGTQQGTIHFGHLADPGRGLLRVAMSPREHHEQLLEAFAGAGDWPARQARFLEHFVRPGGLGSSAALCFARAIEDLCASGSQPLHTGVARRSAAARAAAVLWRQAPLDAALAVCDRLVRLRASRRPLTVARARLTPDVAAGRAQLVDRLARRARAQLTLDFPPSSASNTANSPAPGSASSAAHGPHASSSASE